MEKNIESKNEGEAYMETIKFTQLVEQEKHYKSASCYHVSDIKFNPPSSISIWRITTR